MCDAFNLCYSMYQTPKGITYYYELFCAYPLVQITIEKVLYCFITLGIGWLENF